MTVIQSPIEDSDLSVLPTSKPAGAALLPWRVAVGAGWSIVAGDADFAAAFLATTGGTVLRDVFMPDNTNAVLKVQQKSVAAFPYTILDIDHWSTSGGNQGGSIVRFTNNGTTRAAITSDSLDSTVATDEYLTIAAVGATSKIRHRIGSTDILVIDANGLTTKAAWLDGHLRWTTDNTYDIGTTGGVWNRPRHIYAGGNVVSNNNISALGNITGSSLTSSGAISGTGTLTIGTGANSTLVTTSNSGANYFDMAAGGAVLRFMNSGIQLFGSVQGNWIPNANNTLDLGSTGSRWRTLYAGGNIQLSQSSSVRFVGGTANHIGRFAANGGDQLTWYDYADNQVCQFKTNNLNRGGLCTVSNFQFSARNADSPDAGMCSPSAGVVEIHQGLPVASGGSYGTLNVGNLTANGNNFVLGNTSTSLIRSNSGNFEVCSFSTNAMAIFRNTGLALGPALVWLTDNISDIGGAGNSRPRDVNVGRNLVVAGTGSLGAFTVATLPSASANTRAEANVTDSSVTTFGSTVAGGGSSNVKVRSNGTNWTVCGI